MNRTLPNVRSRSHKLAEIRSICGNRTRRTLTGHQELSSTANRRSEPDGQDTPLRGCPVSGPTMPAPMGGFILDASRRVPSKEYDRSPYQRREYPRAAFVWLQFLLSLGSAFGRRDHVADREDRQHANRNLHGPLPSPARQPVYSMSVASQSDLARGSFPLPVPCGVAEPRCFGLHEKFEMEFRR